MSGGDRYALLARLASLALLVGLWALLAEAFDSRALPSPMAVGEVLRQAIASGDLACALGATLIRVAACFVLAMSLGALLGYAMGRSKTIDALFDAWLIILLNVPALVIIILAYIWLGLTETAAIVAATLAKLPNVATTVREGVRSLDPGLDAMAKVYRLSPMTRLREIALPQLQPYLAAAARNGLSLIWKIVLVIELLGRSNGIGFEVHTRFQIFDVAGILAYSLSFSAIMLGMEFFVTQPLERRARRWRVASA